MDSNISKEKTETPSKGKLFIEGKTEIGPNWNNVTLKESDFYPSNRVKYDNVGGYGIEAGYQTKNNSQYSLGISETEYDVKVDNNPDTVKETRVILHHGYIFRNDIYGIHPFVKVGYGVVGQHYDKTEFMCDETIPADINRIDIRDRIGGAVFEMTLGGRTSIMHKNINLFLGLQYLRLTLFSEDTANEPLGSDPWGSTEQFNLILSLSCSF